MMQENIKLLFIAEIISTNGKQLVKNSRHFYIINFDEFSVKIYYYFNGVDKDWYENRIYCLIEVSLLLTFSLYHGTLSL